jgi:predicted ATPase/class 3 adenylate cyclase
MDIGSWLRGLGLECYERVFREQAIDAEVLPELSEDDLKQLGVVLGHRKKLLKAIEAFNNPSASVVVAADPPRQAMAAPAITPGAERRQLTVMFVDLVGSTELSARLDPEDLGAVIRSYQDTVTGKVARFEGHVAKYMGDGVLAYFGWPRAHEDDAERAVRSGLAITAAVSTLVTPGGETLAARVGIATGRVVVGDLIGAGAAREETVVGETPNLAARLQALAAPGAVVIGLGTRQLLGGLFELHDLGSHRLKGFAEAVPAFRVLGEAAAESRFEALHTSALTPLVGREHELGLLLERWERARDGEGQVVLLSGEAGIGKSRLLRALIEHTEGEPHTRLRYYCSPYHTHSALHPVIEQLERAAGWRPEDSAEIKLDKLEAVLAEGSERLPEVVPLIAALLSIPADDRYPSPELTPQARKARTFEALLGQLDGLAARRPVLLVFEDAHWIDPTTSELFGLIIERLQHLAVLLVITHRPEFSPPWAGYPHGTPLALGRLGQRQGAQLLARLTGGKALPEEVLAQILAKTDGVPLFVEELTKTVLESGLLMDAGERYELTGPLPPLAIPATLHDSLLARLDRLAPVKEVAQVAACIGREFSHELLAAVALLDDDALRDALARLADAELIFRRGEPPQASYTFKHALVQDAAYESLLKARRQQLHARIAAVLEDEFSEIAEHHPELLARHFTDAGLVARAIDYWFAAGERALRASANIEAIDHLIKGIELLRSLPETPERLRMELRFQTALGPAFLTTRGWAAPEAAQAYARAEALCRALGDSGEGFKAVLGLWVVHQTAGKTHEALRYSEELFRLAEQHDDEDLLLQAHHSAWGSQTWTGEFATAREHAERGVALYDQARHAEHALIYFGHDSGVCARALGGLDLWYLGYPEQAAERSRRAVALAEQVAHPASLAHALNYGILCHQWLRDGAVVHTWGERMARLAAEQRMKQHEVTALFARGWVLARQGHAHSGLPDLQRGLDGCTELGMRLFEPYHKALIAEAYLEVGDAPLGLQVVEEAMRFAEASGLGYWDAELMRLKARLLMYLSPDATEDVEACYLRALSIARNQRARSLELRAATGLARLWADQDRHAEALDLLAPIYAWFTEGFDTPDLREAKALLDTLRA